MPNKERLENDKNLRTLITIHDWLSLPRGRAFIFTYSWRLLVFGGIYSILYPYLGAIAANLRVKHEFKQKTQS